MCYYRHSCTYFLDVTIVCTTSSYWLTLSHPHPYPLPTSPSPISKLQKNKHVMFCTSLSSSPKARVPELDWSRQTGCAGNLCFYKWIPSVVALLGLWFKTSQYLEMMKWCKGRSTFVCTRRWCSGQAIGKSRGAHISMWTVAYVQRWKNDAVKATRDAKLTADCAEGIRKRLPRSWARLPWRCNTAAVAVE